MAQGTSVPGPVQGEEAYGAFAVAALRRQGRAVPPKELSDLFALFNNVGGTAYRVIAKRAPPDEVNDLTRDVLLAAVDCLARDPAYFDRHPAARWAARVAENCAAMRWREVGREEPLDQELPWTNGDGETIDAESELIRGELRRELRAALHHAFAQLNERDRAIAMQCLAYGRSYKEAATMLGLKPSSVAVYLSQVKQKLQHLLLPWAPRGWSESMKAKPNTKASAKAKSKRASSQKHGSTLGAPATEASTTSSAASSAEGK